MVSTHHFFLDQAFGKWFLDWKSGLGRVVIEEAHLWVSTTYHGMDEMTFGDRRAQCSKDVQWVLSTATCPPTLRPYLLSVAGSQTQTALVSASIPPKRRLAVYPKRYPRVNKQLILAIERHIRDSYKNARLQETNQTLVFMLTIRNVNMIDSQLK